MQPDKIKQFDKSITVATFLGSFMIGVLTFMISLEKIEFTLLYREILISLAGISSTLLITSVFGMKKSIVDNKDWKDFFTRSAFYSYEFGFMLVVVLLPLLVLPFSKIGAFIIFFIYIFWFYIWLKDKIKKPTNHTNT